MSTQNDNAQPLSTRKGMPSFMENERQYWLDRPENTTKIFWGLCVLCGILLIGDISYKKHPHFGWDGWFGFYGFFGFFASIGLLLAAKLLRNILGREEDYYDR